MSHFGVLTDPEFRVLELLAEATDLFAALPEHHPSDLDEWARDIHHLQHRVMARGAVRSTRHRFTPMVRSD